MKKLLLSLIIAALTASAANAQFFYGIQFGIFTDANGITSEGNTEQGKSSFNVTVKPSIGYYFTPDLVAGLRFHFTSCSFAENASGYSVFNINSYAMNLLMGNGLDRDYLAWKVSPYVRYKMFGLFKDKLRLWAELNGYIGMRFPRNAEHRLTNEYKMLYGAELHPVISYDISDKFMVFTALNFLSLHWDGSTQSIENSAGKMETRFNNQFYVQANPLVAVAHAVLNFGVMRKF